MQTSSVPWERFFDVGLSLGILALISKVLWSKLTKLEERMDNYLKEDRDKMLETISKNTDALNEHTETNKKILEKLQ